MDKLIAIMKIVLGTTFALYLKAHAAHWNVEGPMFPEYHRFFGELYGDLWRSVDDIAEHIRQLDAYAPGSMERFTELSRIKSNNEILPPNDVVIMLMKDTEIMIIVLTEALHLAGQTDKQGLVNFLSGRIEVHSKQRWQLRATAKRLA